jgi:alginate O-acetyltransferase complex protein AlgI
VSLFSQLVAGPIVRFRQIEQDLENLGTADRTRWLSVGLSFFVTGLVEKVLVADTLAHVVDPALAQYQALSTGGAWIAMLAYSFQLYFDFSGYSSMAVGLGYLFGIRIPQNFNSPYKSLDPSDFWRRWHISLSSCLRDYVYIPLGGNRKSEFGTYRNLMLTMLVGGLWHGANWTFVVWGGYHGLLLALYRRWGRALDAVPAAVRQVGMFVLVVVGWVFFRATDFTMAASLLRRMFLPTGGDTVPSLGWVLVLLTVAAAWAMLGPNAFDIHRDWRLRPRTVLIGALAAGVCLALMLGTQVSPFLYFQF